MDLMVVGDPVLVGAGDIADCEGFSDDKTGELLDHIRGLVITLGDNAYPYGAAADYANCYDPTWGRHRGRTRPTPGNHEYESSPDAAGYFSYFGRAAGDSGKGYYSYDFGTWHIIALNSSLQRTQGTAQLRWLTDDLAAHPASCTLAYFHFPLFSSGLYAIPAMKPVWQVLYNAGVDVVLNGHDHHYERFAPQDPQGVADPLRGIREFIVGTGGGAGHHPIVAPAPNSEVRDTTAFGVLKLGLRPGAYSWRFIPIDGIAFADSGTASCH